MKQPTAKRMRKAISAKLMKLFSAALGSRSSGVQPPVVGAHSADAFSTAPSGRPVTAVRSPTNAGIRDTSIRLTGS